MQPRLKSKLWINAYIRRCSGTGLMALVAKKGDETAGAICVRVNRLDGTARVFTTVYDGSGDRQWQPATASDPCSDEEADAYIERALARDPDLWVVELDNKTGDPHLDGF